MTFGKLVRDFHGAVRAGEREGWNPSHIECGNGALTELTRLAKDDDLLAFSTKGKPRFLGLPLKETTLVPDNKMVVICTNGSALVVLTLPTPDTGKGE